MGRKKKIEAIELKGKDRKNTHLSHVNLKRNSLFQKTISNQKKKYHFFKAQPAQSQPLLFISKKEVMPQCGLLSKSFNYRNSHLR